MDFDMDDYEIDDSEAALLEQQISEWEEIRYGKVTPLEEEPLVVLGGLPSRAIVTEPVLARMLGKHPVSIQRAVERGELPPSVRLMGKPVWTVGSLIDYIEKRLEVARQTVDGIRRQ